MAQRDRQGFSVEKQLKFGMLNKPKMEDDKRIENTQPVSTRIIYSSKDTGQKIHS